MQDEDIVVVVNDTSARWFEIADDVDVGLLAGLRVVPVASEMHRFDGVCSLSLHNENLGDVSMVF
jgi:hypothetical protein